MLFTRVSLLLVVSQRCGTHPPVRAPLSWQQDTSRAENFLATSTELTQASVQRLLMILFARGGHLATPEIRAGLSLDHIRLFHVGVIKSIVSPGQAALSETRKNGLRVTALPSQLAWAEAGHDGRNGQRGSASQARAFGDLFVEDQQKSPRSL